MRGVCQLPTVRLQQVMRIRAKPHGGDRFVVVPADRLTIGQIHRQLDWLIYPPG
jgi:hypothetical protein